MNKKGFDKMYEIDSEKVFNELIDIFEHVEKLTKVARKQLSKDKQLLFLRRGEGNNT